MANEYRPGTGQKIERLYAWLATEPDGGQGIVSIQIEGMWVPLAFAGRDLIDRFTPDVEGIHALTGYPMELVEFSEKKVLETMK